MIPEQERTPFRLALILTGVIFAVEALIMLILPSDVHRGWKAMADVSLLMVGCTPAIYFLLFRPMDCSLHALRRANDHLDQRVLARTAELSASEKKYRDLVENLGPGLVFYKHDTVGVFDYVSPSITQLLGYSQEEFMNHYTTYLTDDPINREVIRRIKGSIRGEYQPPYEVAIRHKDNSVHRLEVTEVPLRDEAGRLVAVEGFAFDITRRKLAESSAHRALELQNAINRLQGLAIEMITLDEALARTLEIVLALPWLACEPKAAIFLQDEKRSVLRMHAEKGFSPESRAACAEVPVGTCLCGRAAATGEMQYSIHLDERHEIRPEGICDHGHYSVPLKYADRVVGVLVTYLPAGYSGDDQDRKMLSTIARTIADMIVRKKSEEEKERLRAQYLQSQKMESVGRLAGGVAHDFNNILTVIRSSLDFLALDRDSKPDHNEIWKEISDSTERAALLTRQLLAFSRRQVLSPRLQDLNRVVTDLNRMLARLLGEDVVVTLRLASTLPPVFADRSQLEQVIVNLAVNARDAMPDGGTLTLSTETTEIGPDHPRLPCGRYSILAISDTGSGISPEIMDRIFDPFFTTKEVGKGSGLGLSMVFGIIEQSGGHVTVESQVGRGSCFRIFLPAGAGAAPVDEVHASNERVAGGHETLLLVEDEESIRRVTVRALEKVGYTILAAANGDEALEIIQRHGAAIDLMLTDVVMPGMTGAELAGRIMKTRPDLKIVFMSGYTEEEVVKKGIREDAIFFLPKPFSIAALTGKIREVLDE